ncbi:Aquaporin-1 [Gnomoniopsis smithogilvyi]|uniref:Aquaporin-1 n=1 Tax=Gnomoniopsis smithogilvyi TaxID=1191159 RepID=A0A9W8YLG2_9PEZI|nr:Aquaporin-1 [Gnomoniopsis smithogilvyi]
MSLPATTIEMTRTGNSNEPSLIIRQSPILEPTKARGPFRPKYPFGILTDAARGHIIAMIGEYLGTFMFLFFGYIAAQTGNEKADITLRSAIGAPASPPGPSLIQISYISAVFGLSLATNVFIWYRVSGGMFNPSVSFGLWLAGAFNWVRLLCVIPAQIMGSITAAGIVSAMLPGKLQAENSLGSNVSQGQGFVAEMVLTAMLMGTILMLAVEKHRATFLAPFGIGLALLLIHLAGINVSGASVNPARSLGVAIVNGHYVPEFWIYFVGPTVGAVISVGVHWLLNALAYETANPGQDGDGMDFYRVVAPKPSPESDAYSMAKDFSYGGNPSYTEFPRPAATRFSSNQRQPFGKQEDETMLLQDNMQRSSDKKR